MHAVRSNYGSDPQSGSGVTPVPPQAISTLSDELDRFLQFGQIKRFHLVAPLSDRPPPPPTQSILVPYPQLTLALHQVDSAISGEVEFAPANSWSCPACKLKQHEQRVMQFLFAPRHCEISLILHEAGGKQSHCAAKASLPAIGGSIRDILAAITLLPLEHSVEEVGPHLARALLHCMAHELKRRSDVKVRKARNTYEKICLYLQEHFHQAISRELVAEQFQLNPNHLSRLFRQEGLMRFTDYLARVRVDRAKYLLKNYDHTLDDLAQRCGFRDATYFCRVFKKRTHQTPIGYRMESRGLCLR